MQTINIWHAIAEMRALTAKGDDLDQADHKRFYEDLNVSDPKKARQNCWQILIVRFNGTPVTPNHPYYENI